MASPTRRKTTRARRKKEEEVLDVSSLRTVHSFSYGDTTFEVATIQTDNMSAVVFHRTDSDWGLPLDAIWARKLGIQLLRAADVIDPDGSSFSELQPEPATTERRRDDSGRFV